MAPRATDSWLHTLKRCCCRLGGVYFLGLGLRRQRRWRWNLNGYFFFSIMRSLVRLHIPIRYLLSGKIPFVLPVAVYYIHYRVAAFSHCSSPNCPTMKIPVHRYFLLLYCPTVDALWSSAKSRTYIFPLVKLFLFPAKNDLFRFLFPHCRLLKYTLYYLLLLLLLSLLTLNFKLRLRLMAWGKFIWPACEESEV